MSKHLTILFLLALAAPSSAVILDLENLAGGIPSPDGNVINYPGSLTIGDYRLTVSSGSFTAWTASGAGYTGSTALAPPVTGRQRTVTISRTDGGRFDALGADVAAFQASGTGNVSFGGYGDEILPTQSQAVSGLALHTVVLKPWFKNLTALQISTSTGLGSTGGNPLAFQFDNLNLVASPVPEPASLAALGLGAASLLRRRRKA